MYKITEPEESAIDGDKWRWSCKITEKDNMFLAEIYGRTKSEAMKLARMVKREYIVHDQKQKCRR
jgi:hypothetical protein